ncbi:hypothetical protein DL240_01025 [Lujinxingia litoralis]|uniref:PatA-like N-terminal domain-containing protein n=1 Tax=Lujinxingia litoralis TaxID=2211119 RepID=A0A328CAL6_9DELT|nr:DUF4388 domain-containing protein [Lujinxingia litoralis]RAL24824.1 hypothetical protein DL240_01025 [Lujinxingia litoralis]
MLQAGGFRVRGVLRGAVHEALVALARECPVVVEALEESELVEALEATVRQGLGERVVVITDAREVRLRVRLIEAGVAQVVARPLSSAELIARVARVRRLDSPAGLQGALKVVGLSDVLMLLHQQRASGELHVRGQTLQACIWMERGALLGARASQGLWGEKALFRALRVFDEEEGFFDFRDPRIKRGNLGLAHFEVLPALMLRGAQHADEFRALRASLPDGPLRASDGLTYSERCAEVFSILARDPERVWSVDALIDASSLLDLEVARQIHEAFKRQEVCCVQPPRHDPAGC